MIGVSEAGGDERHPGPSGPPRPASSDLFSSLMQRQRSRLQASATEPAVRAHSAGQPRDAAPPLAPLPPRSLRDTGLTLARLSELTLKHLYLHGSLTGGEIADHLRLPFSGVEEALR
jgi:hypothetical protein